MLPSSLWCPYLGGITLLWVVWCFPIFLIGDRALVFIFWSPRIHYVICHWSDRRRWQQFRQQSPEFLLVNLSILTASFYKHCHWQWPSDIRLMQVGCSRGSEALLVLVSPYLEMLDFDLEVSCSLLIQQAPTQRFNYCTLDQWPLVKSATRSLGLQQLILALLIFQRISYLFLRDYPHDKNHEGDITLVTLGSVLACFSCVEEELFF